MKSAHCYADRSTSPLGDLWFVLDESGALMELQFHDGKMGSGNKVAIEERYAGRGLEVLWDAERLKPAREALQQYFAGDLREFDLRLNPRGTDFQKRVWQELLRIPYGTTCSYGTLARRIGQPSAARAVGLANGKNPIAIVIPCHRVIGSDGSLTGYAGGMDKKETLLCLEGCLLF